MKVLHVCTVPTERSGIPRVIFNILNEFEPDILSCGYVAINNPDTIDKERLKRLGIELHVITREIFHPLRYIWKLSKIAKGYDIIHVHGNSATMVLEMIAAKLARVKIRIAHSHNTSCNMKVIDKLMRPLFYTLCNGRMACGEEAGRWLFGNKKFRILNNGINAEKYRFNPVSRDQLRMHIGWFSEIVIGHVGNFVEQKNHHFLIEIFEALVLLNKDVRLLLLGSGPLQSNIYDCVVRLGLADKVYFAGSVDNPQDYMSVMDFVIMPSLHEGLPLTLIEEQANGLNALVADTITLHANITGNIYYMSLNDVPQKWASFVLSHINDENRLQKSQDNIGNIKVAGYDVKTSAESLKGYYIAQLSNIR